MARQFEPRELRQAFGAFPTGVTVLTTLDEDGRPCGMTASSFTSVSLDPPLVLVCVGKGSTNIAAFEAAEHFAINILGHDQAALATTFATRDIDRFATVEWAGVHTGAPVLSNSLGWFDCTLHQRVEAGDHIILIGRVEELAVKGHAPLGFCRGKFVALAGAAT